ncbi:hypothetical protein NIB75_11215 [Bacteroides uniformis]|nr:hypothetical protein [Bacteroides uniformis]
MGEPTKGHDKDGFTVIDHRPRRYATPDSRSMNTPTSKGTSSTGKAPSWKRVSCLI